MYVPITEYRQLLGREDGLNNSLISSVTNLQAVGLQVWNLVVIILLGCFIIVFIVASLFKKVSYKCCGGHNTNKCLVVSLVITFTVGASFAVYLVPKINDATLLHKSQCIILQKAQAIYTGVLSGDLYRLEFLVQYVNGTNQNVTAIAYEDPAGTFTAGNKASQLNNYSINSSSITCYIYVNNPQLVSLNQLSEIDEILIGVALPVPFLLLILELYCCIKKCKNGAAADKLQQNDDDNIFKAKETTEKDDNDGLGKTVRGGDSDTLKKLRTL